LISGTFCWADDGKASSKQDATNIPIFIDASRLFLGLHNCYALASRLRLQCARFNQRQDVVGGESNAV